MKVVRPLLYLILVALASCKGHPKKAVIVTSPDYKKAVSFIDRQNDSAYYYFNKVVLNSKDSLQIAMAYNNMALIQSNEGDYYGGQETVLASLRYLQEKRQRDKFCLTADYNLLGNIALKLQNYDGAIDYYGRELQLIKDEGSKAIALNNKAHTLQKKGDYTSAIAIYESILSKSNQSKKEYARVMTNLAISRWSRDSNCRAGPELLAALRLREAASDDWGRNSSYAHLADYYLHIKPDSALMYAKKMYAVASRLESPDDEIEALQKLILLSPPKEVRSYFLRFQRLSDSLEAARSAAKNQFALIRYEAQKNKADNLRLQNDNAGQRIRIIREQIIIYSTILAFAIAIGGITLWHRRRKLRLQSENRKRLLALSQKVHDTVANDIYELMQKVQYQEGFGKDQLLDTLDDLYERSRDISHDQPSESNPDFHETLGEMLKTLASPAIRLSIVGNQKDLWEDIGETKRTQVALVLKELMVNMEKHSRAENVLVRFYREADRVAVRYSDDGIGFPGELRDGNGLANTENRIKNVGGCITFSKNNPKGVVAEIHFPID